MFVRFLESTPYTPARTDSDRCYGQLRLRPSKITEEVDVEVTREQPDGTRATETVRTTRTVCGPMEHYFSKGATPDLSPEVAQKFIAAGVAVPFESDITVVSKSEIEALVFGVKA